MRASFPEEAERGRVLEAGPWGSKPFDRFGAFFLRRKGILIKVIASDGTDEIPWEHVSASTKVRTPTWEEMSWIKDLFWTEDETVVQYHPAKAHYVNHHPFCLHLWKPLAFEMQLPPTIAVGPVNG